MQLLIPAWDGCFWHQSPQILTSCIEISALFFVAEHLCLANLNWESYGYVFIMVTYRSVGKCTLFHAHDPLIFPDSVLVRYKLHHVFGLNTLERVGGKLARWERISKTYFFYSGLNELKLLVTDVFWYVVVEQEIHLRSARCPQATRDQSSVCNQKVSR